jgi:hypothetical protein
VFRNDWHAFAIDKYTDIIPNLPFIIGQLWLNPVKISVFVIIHRFFSGLVMLRWNVDTYIGCNEAILCR